MHHIRRSSSPAHNRITVMRRVARGFAVSALGWWVLTGSASAQPNPQFREYLLSEHVHSLDYNVVSQFGTDDLAWVRNTLNGETQSQFHGNLVIALGILGEAADKDIILRRFRRGTGRLSPTEYRTRHACLLGLGYLVSHTDDRATLSYLVSAETPQFWTDTEGLSWLAPGTADESRRNAELTSAAALALALTGSETALQALDNAEAKFARADRPDDLLVLRAVRQAKIEAAKIRKIGLANYHRQ